MSYINLHTHRFTNKHDILEIVNQYPREFDAAIPYYSIGIHPWYLDANFLDEDLAIIESKLQLENCLAIGECGLDKRIAVPFALQQQVFEAQLHLAQQVQKPVIIHCVAAFQELISIVSAQQITVPIIIHGFSKNEQLAQQLLQQGYYLSFGKYLFQQPELAEVFANVPDNRFFLETDTLDSSIEEVYAKAADCKKMPIDQIKSSLNCTFAAVFKSV